MPLSGIPAVVPGTGGGRFKEEVVVVVVGVDPGVARGAGRAATFPVLALRAANRARMLSCSASALALLSNGPVVVVVVVVDVVDVTGAGAGAGLSVAGPAAPVAASPHRRFRRRSLPLLSPPGVPFVDSCTADMGAARQNTFGLLLWSRICFRLSWRRFLPSSK